MSEPYKILPRGTRVQVVQGGTAVEGVVMAHELSPNRRPGIGRVTYEVRWSPLYPVLRVPAAKVHLPDGTEDNRGLEKKLFGIP
jgi:hypothetical protein